jgi:hypothetical protein
MADQEFEDVYLFLRSTAGLSDELLDTLRSLSTFEGEEDSFTLISGPYARLYVVKQENIGSRSGLAEVLGALDGSKALSAAGCTPDRIVHRHTLPHMAFVRVWVTPNTVPCPVLETIAQLEGFIAGAVVDSHYDILVEFGHETSNAPVQNGARSVATIPGVARASIRYVG